MALKNKKPIQSSLAPKHLIKLQQLAEENGKTKSEMIRYIIELYIEGISTAIEKEK